ncbi:MAG: hypothetical protein GXY44_16685 [Phycisphaerales bacterium]|nr:hypothetical protein [Phycisphaerales bacterium]
MLPDATIRLDHLKRLTDSMGLMRCARGEVPDRFAGYSAVDNADALRLCALVSDTAGGEVFHGLAQTYFRFLTRARLANGRVHHACNAWGKWHDWDDDGIVQSRVALALSTVMVSELPIKLRLSAAHWWPTLLAHAEHARTPASAANWLRAITQLRTADPGRDIERAEEIVRWLVEECYYPIRSTEWEWFELQWQFGAASIPAALWSASTVFDESRLPVIARASTEFVIDNVFTDDMLMPVGAPGGWPRYKSKAIFDQLPSEVCGMVDLFCTAERIDGAKVYGQYAETAAAWFAGHNVHNLSLIDAQTGACHDALTPQGASPNQGASAIVAFLTAQAYLSTRGITAFSSMEPNLLAL